LKVYDQWNASGSFAGAKPNKNGRTANKSSLLGYLRPKNLTKSLTAAPVPTISGTVAVGNTLTAKPGTWKPAPVTLKYQWKRGGSNISGATAATYKVTNSDVGSKITVAVTGSKSGYTTVTKTSAATVAVP